MNTILFYSPLYVLEIEALRDRGFIAVDRARIVPGDTIEKCLSRADFLWSLRNAIPDVPMGEEQSVVIAVFVKASPLHREESLLHASGKVCFEAKDCQALIPLTTISGELNAGRFPNFIFQKAVFEAFLEESNLLAKQNDKLRGASEMISILCIPDTSIDLSPPHNFHISENRSNSLISKILEYQRHSPAPREPISALRDLRVILRESLPNPKDLNPPLLTLSAWGEKKWEKTSGFLQVYADPELQSCLHAIDIHWCLPFRAAALAIFLHWRELYLRYRSLDLDAYLKDCYQLVNITDGQVIAEALWLLGYSTGFSAFSESYYERLETPNALARNRKAIKKIRLQKQDDPPATPEPNQVAATEPQTETKQADGIEEATEIKGGPIDSAPCEAEPEDLKAAGTGEKDEVEHPATVLADDLQVESNINQSPLESDAESSKEKPHSSDLITSVPTAEGSLNGLLEQVPVKKKKNTKPRGASKPTGVTEQKEEHKEE